MRLYLVTHAHTQQQQDVDTTGWVLSAEGVRQAAQLSRQPFWAEVDRIALSSEPKTRLTVQPVLRERNLPVLVEPRFDELRRGVSWIDDYTARVAQVFARPEDSIGGWEPAATALARFLDGIAELRRRFSGETLALVGHGLTLSLYRAYLLGREEVVLADWRQLSFAAVAQVDLDGNRLVADFRPVAGRMDRGT
jgi:broad specificity phosphatase PhoE